MTQEEFIRRIRACGQAIVDHAEDIAGDYLYQTNYNMIKSVFELEEKYGEVL